MKYKGHICKLTTSPQNHTTFIQHTECKEMAVFCLFGTKVFRIRGRAVRVIAATLTVSIPEKEMDPYKEVN